MIRYLLSVWQRASKDKLITKPKTEANIIQSFIYTLIRERKREKKRIRKKERERKEGRQRQYLPILQECNIYLVGKIGNQTMIRGKGCRSSKEEEKITRIQFQ